MTMTPFVEGLFWGIMLCANVHLGVYALLHFVSGRKHT
jgi:hypothetical protein